MIQLKNISHSVNKGAKAVLKNISAQIQPGTLTAIMGLNGSGKTTLLNIMNGLTEPTQGQVILNGKAPKNLDARERARLVARVPQDFHSDFPFSVIEFVLMGRFAWQKDGKASQHDKEFATEILHQLNLIHLRERQIQNLSGGERQKILLARTLVQDTPIIFLDEPLNHLDMKNKKFILNILSEENQKKKKTIVAILHDLEEVMRYFNDVLLLKNSELKYHGPVSKGLTSERIQEVFEIEAA